MLILGGMSGSSLDGLDLALVNIEEDAAGTIQWSIESADTIPYPTTLIDSLTKAPQMSGKDLYYLEGYYSQLSADFVSSFIEKSPLAPELIGWHGHTIFHNPEQNTTMQMGHGSHIAAKTGIATVAQFRLLDLALRGQGAPLAPLVEVDLLPSSAYFANLGGICNISKHGRSIRSADVVACNQILNKLAQRLDMAFDHEGKVARSGELVPDLLERLQQIEYHQRPLPKSMDNSWVMDTVWPIVQPEQHTANALCTMVEYISLEIVRFIKQLEGDRQGSMVINGGGVFNTYLVERITAHLQPFDITVITPNPKLVEFKEAVLMAYMAYCFVNGRRNVLSSVTGSKHDHVGGCLYQGRKPLRLHA